jgi:hypothetical protein
VVDLRLVLFCTGRNQVPLYEAQVEKEEYFSNGQKRHMLLQNAVRPVQELRAVKTQADQHKTQAGKELTYDQYVNLLLSAASAYDAQFAPKLLAVLRILTTSQHQAMTMILPTISSAHSTSSSQRPLTLLHKLLIMFCTLTISQSQTMTRILPRILTAHSASSRPMVVHLAPAWHFHSGHSCLRMRKTFGTSSQTRQKTFSNLRASRCRINQDPGDWYMMAAFTRQHLLPFGNYALHYFWRLV